MVGPLGSKRVRGFVTGGRGGGVTTGRCGRLGGTTIFGGGTNTGGGRTPGRTRCGGGSTFGGGTTNGGTITLGGVTCAGGVTGTHERRLASGRWPAGQQTPLAVAWLSRQHAPLGSRT